MSRNEGVVSVLRRWRPRNPFLGELATAARHSLPITALVFNDAALSLIDVKQQQRGFKANEVRYPGINFADMAEGANWRSYRVNNPR
ncbi:MAG: thiamine pyrophosphate-dependent enzyme [Alphaproteobacteria bacterium]